MRLRNEPARPTTRVDLAATRPSICFPRRTEGRLVSCQPCAPWEGGRDAPREDDLAGKKRWQKMEFPGGRTGEGQR